MQTSRCAALAFSCTANSRFTVNSILDCAQSEQHVQAVCKQGSTGQCSCRVAKGSLEDWGVCLAHRPSQSQEAKVTCLSELWSIARQARGKGAAKERLEQFCSLESDMGEGGGCGLPAAAVSSMLSPAWSTKPSWLLPFSRELCFDNAGCWCCLAGLVFGASIHSLSRSSGFRKAAHTQSMCLNSILILFE